MSKSKSPHPPIQYLDVTLTNEQATRLLHEMIKVMHGYLTMLYNDTSNKKMCDSEEAGAIGEMIFRVGSAIHAITVFDGLARSEPEDKAKGLRVQEFFSDDREQVEPTDEGITYCRTMHLDLYEAVRRVMQ